MYDYRYYKKNKHQIYDCIAGNLGDRITLKEDMVIRIDKSNRKQFLREQFDSHFEKKLNTNNRRIEISHSESNAWSGLQFADLIADAYFQKFERRNNQFVDLIDINSNLQKL